MFVHLQILVLIQVLIGFVKSVGISTNVSLNSSIIPVSPPKVIYIGYVHKNDTGLGKVSKEISRAELRSGLFVSDNGTVSASQDNLSKNHVKKFTEPTVNGNWGNWGKYGPPSKTCDEGFRTRFRECNNPQPRGFGKPCKGSDRESFLVEFGRCVLKKLDTEFNRFSMGMWKHEEGTPGFFWKIMYQPSRDATGDGYFLLADSNWRKREDQAKIISDTLTPAPKVNRACLKFHYRMDGSGMGLLTVKIKRNSRKPKEIWSAYGDHGNKWVKSRVTLKSSVKFQVLFVAAIGTPQLSHFALDSIYVDNGPCKCQDEYQSCPEWAANGKCDDKKDNETYYWMAKNCKTSCNSCYCRNLADFKKCRRWAEEGYCSSHLTWMSAHCQLSCRLCACRDFLDYADCQNRVSSYECETEPQWMADKCKLSCGFCGCRNVLSDEECQRRMMGGECVSNPIYMSSNCKYSCGYCNCKNRHLNCSVWAAQGECKKNSFWMDVYCTLSCGKCKCHDSNTRCKGWKEQGECYNNPLYMSAFCQKSCEICRENINGSKNTQRSYNALRVS